MPTLSTTTNPTRTTKGLLTTDEPGNFFSVSSDSIDTILGQGYFDDFNLPNTCTIRAVVGNQIHILGVINGTAYVYADSDGNIPVLSPVQFSNPIDPTKMYVLNGVIDMTGTGINIKIPAGGFNFKGSGIGVSGIICSDNNYTLMESEVGGSGTIFGKDCFLSVTGTNSKVFDLTDATGFNAFEFNAVNFNDCTSLGEINRYRQGLEVGTGRLGGTPELTMSGTWLGGYRISTSIAFNMNDFDALFKAGAGFTFSGRVITDINCDLPATGALFDFSESNVVNDESLIIDGAYVQRQGVLDASDTTLYPNIDHKSVKSNWSNNTGLPNTQKYIKIACTSEIPTDLSSVSVGTYLPLTGTFSLSDATQFSMPSNGEIELLTGNGLYSIVGTIQLEGTAGDLVDLRVTRSTDGGVTYPEEVNHIQLEIANLSGPTDFATYSINFGQVLVKGDRLRLEVENNTATRDVTMRSESYLIISEV